MPTCLAKLHMMRDQLLDLLIGIVDTGTASCRDVHIDSQLAFAQEVAPTGTVCCCSLDSMLKDISELENRLFDIALQSPDDGGDPFDDAFADPTEAAERKVAKQEAAAKEAAVAPNAAEGAKRAVGMNKEMKKRQEETAAEVTPVPMFVMLKA